MKRFLIACAVLVATLVATLVIGPGFVDWNRYRADIAAHIAHVTGRPVTLNGAIGFTLLPSPVLSLAGVRLGDEMQVGRLEVRMATAPLLQGRIQIDSVVLLSPEIVVTAPEGSDGWWAALTGITAAQPAGTLPQAISLDRVSVRDGTVVLRGGLTTGGEERLTGIEVQGSAESLLGPLQVQGALVARGVSWQMEAHLGRIGGGGAVPLRASLSNGEADTTLKLSVILAPGGRDTWSEPRIQGDVRIEGSDYRKAQALWERLMGREAGSIALEPAPARQPVASTAFALRAAIDAGASRSALQGIDVAWGDSRGEGSVTLTEAGTGTDVTAATAAARRRLDLVASFSRFDAALWGNPTSWGQSLGAVWPLPKSLDLTVDLSADALLVSGGAGGSGGPAATVRDGRLKARSMAGAVTVDLLAARLPGDTTLAATGSVTAGEGNLPAGEIVLEVKTDQLRAVCAWLGLDVHGIPEDRLRRLAASIHLRGHPGSLEIPAFEIKLDAAQLNGSFNWADIGRPQIALRLDADRLHLDGYPPLADWVLRQMRSGAEGVGGLARGLDALDGSIRLDLGQVTLGGVTSYGVLLDGGLDKGRWLLRRAQVNDLLGVKGSLQGRGESLSTLSGSDLTFAVEAASLVGLHHWPVLAEVPLERFGAVKASGRWRGGPERGTLELAASGAGAALSLAGTVSDLTGELLLDLKIRAKHPDGGALARLFMPALTLDPGALDLYSEITGTPSALSLSAIQGLIGSMAVRGDIIIDRLGPRPEIVADLQTGDVLLDRLLPKNAGAPLLLLPLRPVITVAPYAGDPPPVWEFLRKVDARIALTAAGLVSGGLRLEQPAMKLRLENGTLAIEALDAGFVDGRLGLAAKVQPAEAPTGGLDAAYALTLVGARLKDVPLLGGADGSPVLGLTGTTLDLDVDLASQGAHEAALLANMSGSGRVVLRDGAVVGMNFARLGERVARTREATAAENSAATAALAGGETRFTRLDANFTLENGIVRGGDLRLILADGADLRGSGHIDLTARRLEMDATLTPNGAAVLATARLAGPLDKPTLGVYLDAVPAAPTTPPPSAPPLSAPALSGPVIHPPAVSGPAVSGPVVPDAPPLDMPVETPQPPAVPEKPAATPPVAVLPPPPPPQDIPAAPLALPVVVEPVTAPQVVIPPVITPQVAIPPASSPEATSDPATTNPNNVIQDRLRNLRPRRQP